MSEEPTVRADDGTLDSAAGTTNREVAPTDGLVERGTALGRYVVLGHVGSGGMGAVFAAYDPELDRKVALKLLHRETDGGKPAQDRLVREAQAMARLRHPNVVVVHDVGVVEGRVFFAMEFVEGTTLTSWLLARDRSLPEVLAVMRAAGAGLAAAHRAGLVHRDFKPDNVLVALDGTVVVTDFGLARALDVVEPPRLGSTPPSSSANILASPLTVSGALLGTPAYMAPEQFQGGDPGPASDQFSFCVALHQAVYGVRPFEAVSIAELVASVTQGRVVDPPPGRRVPAWLRRVILRGLAVDPTARWPSMDVLLARLARNPPGRRRQIAALVGAAALAGTVGVLAASVGEPPAPAEPCPRADDRLAGLWDDGKRDEVRAAFAATGRPYAATTVETVITGLDAYAAAWLDGHEAACRATRVDGTQSETMLDHRMACLDRRKQELGVRVEALVAVDDTLAERAVEYVGRLVPLDVCADVERLASTDLRPEDPTLREEVDELLAELDRIDALDASGKTDDVLLGRMQALARRADATGHDPTRAEARHRLARTFQQLERPADARREHELALAAAASGHHDRLAAAIWIDLVALVGNELDKPAEAITLAQTAELAVVRDGDRPEQRATFSTNLAIVKRRTGDFAGAIALHERALELRRTLHGPDGLDVASTLNNLANAHGSNGDFQKSLELHEQALVIRGKAYGDTHPRVAETLNNIGAALSGLSRYEEALGRFERVVEIRRTLWGDEHPLVASALANLGSTLADLERYEEAEVVQRRALAMLETVYGPDSPRLALSLNNLANTLERRRSYDEALALHERSLAVRRKHDGEKSLPVARALANIGILLDNMERTDEARPRLAAALAIFDEVAPEHPDAANALARIGELALEDAKPIEAAQYGQRAHGILTATKSHPAHLAEVDWLLARAFWDTGDEGRAIGHAKAAQAYVRSAGLRSTLATDVDAWLATHAP
jgi:eukaryotic-like serine/threonine-protein kinase